MRPFDKKLGSATLKVDIVGVKSLQLFIREFREIREIGEFREISVYAGANSLISLNSLTSLTKRHSFLTITNY